MEIEKERGISVTSSVLQFNYDGYCINILDTPGHQDFSEDTYRTLMAADSAVMVIDASKGVEAQTRKLFKVCVMRHIPIFTFINKMDRDANDTFELLDDIEKELGIATCPINWPIGSGKEFKGVYERGSRKVTIFKDTEKGTKEGLAEEISVDSPELKEFVGEDHYGQLMDEIELLDGASAEFDQELVDKGELSPVFFGSALTNFGVEIFLKHFLQMTTSPLPRVADIGVIDPIKEDFSAFVFKIQANMNKAHRDRIAFMRICSGRFDAGMLYYMPQTWTSDDTDAVERLYIQYGTSLCYPVSAMGAHVSAVPNHQANRVTSLKMRGDVAMSGNFGYELDLMKFTEEEKEEVKKQVAVYKELREFLPSAQMYRLENPFEGNTAAWQFISEDGNQIFAAYFRILCEVNPGISRMKFTALDPDARYEIIGEDQTYYGDELMEIGLVADFWGDFQSRTWRLKKL